MSDENGSVTKASIFTYGETLHSFISHDDYNGPFLPGFIEKKVEVEVEKVVEKIVEKPVIQEKIIEKEIEVPKQIERKVFVHVPFQTDDPEVLKKGPIIYNDKDNDKGKK